jgi:acyl-coenzyme A thioesterase PaaI-like protein
VDDTPPRERRRVAQALRELARLITTVDVDDVELAPIASALETLSERLTAAPRLDRTGRALAYDLDPLIGLSNPLAPPLRRVEGGGPDEWEVTFGTTYEGHPGLVHGGYVAAVIDHVLGVAAVSSGVTSMTGTLTTRYRRPTPLNTRLVCLGTVERVEGRKVFCRATLTADGELLAEADGIYLHVDPTRF